MGERTHRTFRSPNKKMWSQNFLAYSTLLERAQTTLNAFMKFILKEDTRK